MTPSYVYEDDAWGALDTASKSTTEMRIHQMHNRERSQERNRVYVLIYIKKVVTNLLR